MKRLMTSYHWQLEAPINSVIFDCDGTLSILEGIDELAKKNGVGTEVKSLTAQAMGQTGLNPELYEHRLNLVKPTREQVLAQGMEYFTCAVPDAERVIQLFQRLHKTIYIISAGLYPAVLAFGELLGVPRKNIFAVPVEFDEHGEFVKYDHNSPLVHRDGKRVILNTIKNEHPEEMIYIGDGLNDYEVYHMVKRFVGYGGIFYHENLAQKCQYYIQTKSMSALIPLALTLAESESLTPEDRELYDKGLETILNGDVIIK
jgi:phosphoserine phosphatase